jgi:hypothetical protein
MSNEEGQVVAEGWITTGEAEEATGYGAEYLRQLARADKVKSRKFAGRWLFNRKDLLAYRQRMDTLGRKKHDPRGIEHALEGEAA